MMGLRGWMGMGNGREEEEEDDDDESFEEGC